MILSACGIVCSSCRFYPETCGGCHGAKGRPFWAAASDHPGCLLFNCISAKGFQSCGECGKLPCSDFLEQKDPEVSNEAHARELKLRVARLKGQG